MKMKLMLMAFVSLSAVWFSSCQECQKEKEQQDISNVETFLDTEDEAEYTQADSASPQDKGSNDNDENLHGYKYKYDKNTAFEDGRFDNSPDYIAIPAKLRGKPEQILYRRGYALSYNRTTKLANWVAWHLTRSHTYGNVERPLTAMQESFLMTNVCPQYKGLNSGVWNDIEIKCRDWARDEGDVYIVCGPVFFEKRKERELIGASRIPVPDAFFKVVLSNKHKGKGIGFVCENRGGGYDLNDYSMSINEVEELTGIDFFPALPDAMEERIEGTVGRFR